MARHSISMEGEKVALVPLEEFHLPLTLKWRNQDRVRIGFMNPAIIEGKAHREWFSAYLDRNEFMFVILEKAKKRRPVGQAGIYNIDRRKGRAEFGRLMIGPEDALGKGLAKEATRMILDYAFKTMDFKEITIEVLKRNPSAIALYCSLGFMQIRATDKAISMVLPA